MSIICCCICHSSDVACYTKADSAEGGDWERGWMGRRLHPSVRWHQLSSSTRLLERPLFILYTAARLQQLGVVVIACDLLMMFSWNMTLRLLFFRTLSYLSFSFAFLMLSFHHYLPLAFSCSFLLPFRCFPFVFLSFCLPEFFAFPFLLPFPYFLFEFPFLLPFPYLSFAFPILLPFFTCPLSFLSFCIPHTFLLPSISSSVPFQFSSDMSRFIIPIRFFPLVCDFRRCYCTFPVHSVQSEFLS